MVFSSQKSITDRSAELFAEHRQEIGKHTDRLFAGLMLFQWLAGIAAAFWISPRTWAGASSQIHLHVFAAIFLGGLISIPPIILGFTRSGAPYTRHIIAVCQMLTSALLIHLTGGRIETHFHVFGSLAFLAFYRDWKVLIPATVVVAVDHLIRGIYWPQSVFGVLVASPWRWFEHAAWVLFEDIFLVVSCRRSAQEMQKIADRTAELEATNQTIEAKVEERTHELQKLQNVVLQSEKMSAVGQLAGGVAHEINNPLAVILGFSQGLARRLKPGDPNEEPIRAIEEEAKRCKQLVQDLLTFSRVGKTEKEKIDLNETINGALSLVIARSKIKSVDLVKELEEGLPPVLVNLNQIQQVIVNLGNNAIDAMPEGGKLTVRTRKASEAGKDFIEIQIQDTGKGISREAQARIFEPFFTTKEVGQGTGLGLSLVYEIIQKHDGTIRVESDTGKGTVFLITLPVKAAL